MRVLIADDDRRVCDLLAHYVRECGHEVVDAVSAGGLAAIRSFSTHEPDLVLLDLMMPQYSGRTACLQILSRDPSAKVIFVTGHLEDIGRCVMECGAAGFLPKPLTLESMRGLLARFDAAPVAVA